MAVGSQLQQEFEESVRWISDPGHAFTKTVPSSRKLILYSRFKQANEGDIKTDRPGMFSPVERQKWDAWKQCEGREVSEMMQEYIDEVSRQKNEFA